MTTRRLMIIRQFLSLGGRNRDIPWLPCPEIEIDQTWRLVCCRKVEFTDINMSNWWPNSNFDEILRGLLDHTLWWWEINDWKWLYEIIKLLEAFFLWSNNQWIHFEVKNQKQMHSKKVCGPTMTFRFQADNTGSITPCSKKNLHSAALKGINCP